MTSGPSGGGLFTSSQRAALSEKTSLFSDAIAGAGGVVLVPGPAAGFLRYFDGIQVTPNVGSAGLTLVSAALIDASAVVWGLQGPLSSAAGGTSINEIAYTPVGEGETVRITNGGPNAGRVTAVYRDLPVDNVSLVRMNVTNAAPQTVIPAPPAGFYRRWSQLELWQGQIRPQTIRGTWFNADTITHSLQLFLGGALLSRGTQLAAATGATLFQPGGVCVDAASGALEANLAAAVVTNQPAILASYETLRG